MVNLFITSAELAQDRAEAESRMGLANLGCDVEIRRRGEPERHDGVETTSWNRVHESFELPARLRGSRSGAGPTIPSIAGDVQRQLDTPTLFLPWGSGAFREEDVVAVLAGEMAGRFYRVTNVSLGDTQTAIRLGVEEIAKPRDWGL